VLVVVAAARSSFLVASEVLAVLAAAAVVEMRRATEVLMEKMEPSILVVEAVAVVDQSLATSVATVDQAL